MRNIRALVAADPRRFGRGACFELAVPDERSLTLSRDIQLFAATFAAGFVFVSILLA
ncbi:MAG: hypothetical protein H0U83_04575 [Sphingomonas sp.]|nr:hypothetical protein [Sphingomonas sp.]